MKVLIVDDEKHIVEYIKYIVDWEKLGFTMMEATSSSSVARDYLLREQPELMVTDIRMPQLSGLDLAEIVYKERLNTKIIILSGYSDFSYAQKAMHYGTVDYLLKPITKNDLLPVINRVRKSFQVDENTQTIGKEEQNAFFIKLLSTISVSTDDLFKSEQKIGYSKKYLPTHFQLKIADDYLTVFSKRQENGGLLLNLTKANSQQLFCEKLGANQMNYQFPSGILQLIEDEKWQEVLTFAENAPEKNHALFAIDLLQAFSTHFSKLLANIDLGDLLTNGQIFSFLSNYIKEYSVKENLQTLDTNQVAIEKIVSYIKENYNEDITLDTLSELVYMHPVTISRLFKVITGATVTEFISRVRLEAAADLLEHSNLLVSDIGNLVGYHKAQYFITLFKKQYGTTPQKYRRKIRLEGELK
ncbi:MAG TPA: response regulator [Candidatus Tetragenococcus pullicola]|nr:response regulator [Candidatus Tetragenococcus pullicola]